MLSTLEQLLEHKISQYDSMSRQEQLAKLEQILLVYAHGDTHVVEGMKLTYFAIVSRSGNRFSEMQLISIYWKSMLFLGMIDNNIAALSLGRCPEENSRPR